jgi:hypothetical protein
LELGKYKIALKEEIGRLEQEGLGAPHEYLPREETNRTADPKNLLHLIWDSLDSNLQDAFSLAYNKKRREGSNRISTRDLFQALLRVGDDALRILVESLPEGALPNRIGSDEEMDEYLLQMDEYLLHQIFGRGPEFVGREPTLDLPNANPLLSNCVEDSLRHFMQSGPLPRKLSPIDVFIDIGQHGHGPSVARMRKHGITPEELEKRVQKYGLSVVRRVTSVFRRLAKPPLDQNVQFTVYRPKTIRPQEWYPMLAFAHLSERPPSSPENEPDPIQEVKRQASQILAERQGDYQETTEDSTRPVPQEGELTFVPDVSGIAFNPPLRNFVWKETVQREEFRLRASAELDGQTAKGRMTVFLGSIILAEVPLSIRVVSSHKTTAETESHEVERARPYRKIFASYSRKDSWVVREFKRYAQALGDEYVRKHIRLRAGEEWSDRLPQLIQEADIFQLFWSTSSMYSPFVRREWECALSLRRPNFIRPCYWETPLPTCAEKNLPPEELRRMHFQRIPVAFPKPIAEREVALKMLSRERGRRTAKGWRAYTSPEQSSREEEALEAPHREAVIFDPFRSVQLDSKILDAQLERAKPDRALFGQYMIDQKIGAGALGAVYRGHRVSDPLRPLVIKVVPASTNNKELRIPNYCHIANLRHPGIVKIVDVGIDGGQDYVVTDYVEGPSLKQWLRDHRPTWEETARIVAAIAEALDFAHANGLVHRDVKPSHILLAKNDNPILIGFGLATSMSEKAIRGARVVVGTPAYMSPEQILDQRVDGRADIYSLGVILYEMLCARQPFAGLRRVREEEPPPPRQLVPAIPRELEAICLKAMAKRVNDRYTTGADLAADLRRWLEGLPVIPSERAALPWKALLLVSLVVSAILAGLMSLFFF